jgi:hypothetical protein
MSHTSKNHSSIISPKKKSGHGNLYYTTVQAKKERENNNMKAESHASSHEFRGQHVSCMHKRQLKRYHGIVQGEGKKQSAKLISMDHGSVIH